MVIPSAMREESRPADWQRDENARRAAPPDDDAGM